MESLCELSSSVMVAESDEDMEIGASVVAGIDRYGNLVVGMDFIDYEDHGRDYEQHAIVERELAEAMARRLGTRMERLPRLLADRCGDDSRILVPSQVEAVFQQTLEFMLDYGARYRLRRDR